MELFNTISQFDSLSYENILISDICGRYRGEFEEILKSLKLVLEEVAAIDFIVDGNLNKLLEDINIVVREARELMATWSRMTSKLYCVLRIESAMTQIQSFLLKFCNSVLPLVQSYQKDHLEFVQYYAEKLWDRTYDQTSKTIRETIEMQKETGTIDSEHVTKIVDSLQLSTNEDLLSEIVALDNEKAIHKHGDNHLKVEYIDQLIYFVTHLHNCHVEKYQVLKIDNVPIPADFCCPLSLELMSDPVIVASGQTYERAYIRKWLDQGFNVCPKTRQALDHTNLIPNYTVKALIFNWCETHNIKLPDLTNSVKRHDYGSNISLCDHPTGSNFVTSPESHRSIIHSHQNAALLNGIHKEMQNDNFLSAQLRLSSVPFSMPSTEGTQSTNGRLTLSCSSESKGFAHQRKDSHITANDLFEQDSPSTSARGIDNNLHESKAKISDALAEPIVESSASSVPCRQPGIAPRLIESRSRKATFVGRPFDRFSSRVMPSSSMDSTPDCSGLETQIYGFIEGLKSDSVTNQRSATAELRQLSKHSMENRIAIAECGAISHLVSLLQSFDEETQANAVTALLNLSLHDNNKIVIGNADVIDPLIHVLKTGNPEATENAAATIFSLSVIGENKIKIGRSGAIVPLVGLLGHGRPRGKRDAATALFNLSLFHENKLRIVQAGAVRHLIELMDPAAGMIDKAIAALANLATIQEGRNAIGNDGGIPVLVEVVELGSSRGREHAAAALLQLCTYSNRFCGLVLKEGAIPPLVSLSQSGTPRAREKAQSLLSCLRNLRHGNAGRA